MSEEYIKPGFIPNLPPFKAWLASNIPAVYDNTMSYYDELTALIAYIEKEVMPAVNATGAAATQLQSLFTELKNYVDNYFDNLDVQEEINNKLDAMAEAGTLQEIITAYIQANVAWMFDTVADLKLAPNLVNGSYARTLGYHSLGDGGGSTYKITDTGTANEEDVIAVGDLYANLVPQDYVTPEMFGAYGDNSHDDTSAIQDCINYAQTNGLMVRFEAKDYKVTGTIDIPNGTKIEGATTNYSFQENWKGTNIIADFENTDTTNTDPVFNISNDNKNTYRNFSEATTNRTGIQIKNLQINGMGAFCGIKVRGYDIIVENVSVIRCKVGIHIYRTFTSYFTRVNVFFCEIGIYNTKPVGNCIFRDLYVSYGSNILTTTEVSSIVSTTFSSNLETNKICGIYGTNGKITMENCCIECEYYGVFIAFSSILQATYISIESIVTDGAAIADESNNGANFVTVENFFGYNPDNYGGKICIVDYRSSYFIYSANKKPEGFADPTMSTRGVMKVEFRDWQYILPVSISNITGLDMTNNNTKFDDDGNIDVDFVVNDYESQNLSNTTKLILGTLTAGYVDTGHIPIIGIDYKINPNSQAFLSNSTGTFVNTPKKARITCKLKYQA